MSTEIEIEELTIEEVTEYAEELGFGLALHGDSYGLLRSGSLIAVGTLDEIYSLVEVADEFNVISERLAPTGITLH